MNLNKQTIFSKQILKMLKFTFILLPLIGCARPQKTIDYSSPQPTKKSQDSQGNQKQDASDSSNDGNNDGNNDQNPPVVSPEPVVPNVSQLKFSQDFDLVTFDNKDIKISNISTKPKLFVEIVEKGCNSCLASARTLFETVNSGKFNANACAIAIVLLANQQDPNLRTSYRDAIGTGSEKYIYQFKNITETVDVVSKSLGKAATYAPYAGIISNDSSGFAKITLDSLVTSVTTDFINQAAQQCQ